MKKYFSNLNKAIPPKARIGMILVVGVIGAFSYITLTTVFSGSEENDGVSTGMVKIKPVINEESKIKKIGLLSKDNAITRKRELLEKEGIEEKKDSNNPESYFGGIDLSSKEEKESDNVKISTPDLSENDNDVVDLSALFNTDSKKETQKELATANLNKLKIKNEIPVENRAINPLFDRQQFITEVKTSVDNSLSGSTIKWDELNTIKKLSFNTSYSIANKEGTTTKVTNDVITKQDNLSIKESADKKRTQYYERFNNMRKNLQSSINGNTETIITPQDDSKNTTTTTEGEDNYASNYSYGAGEIIYGINNIEINTDEPNIVRAVIAEQGEPYGAILLGSREKINDVVGIRFNKYSKGGVSYPIDAIAIDPLTWKTGLADDVDHHYFSRYTGIIIAALLEGYSETLTNTTSTNTDSGVSESQDKIESFSDRIQYSFGKVGEYLAPKFLENVDRDSTVTVNGDREIGIMFMSDFPVPSIN